MRERVAMTEEDKQLHKELFTAVKNDDVDGVRKAIDQGANVLACQYDDVGYGGLTALHLTKNPEIAELLLNKAQRLNKKGDLLNFNTSDGHIFIHTPISYAVSNRKSEMFEFLLNEGADIHLLTENKGSILDVAVQSGDLNIIKRLVELGAEKTSSHHGRLRKEAKAGIKGQNLNLLHICISNVLSESSRNPILEYLVTIGINPLEKQSVQYYNSQSDNGFKLQSAIERLGEEKGRDNRALIAKLVQIAASNEADKTATEAKEPPAGKIEAATSTPAKGAAPQAAGQHPHH